MSSHAVTSVLAPGRVIVIANKTHRNALGMILLNQKTSPSKDPLDKLFTALILTSNSNRGNGTPVEMKPTAEDEITVPFITRKLSVYDGPCTQIVEEIRGSDIVFVVAKKIKTEASIIIDDHKKRQIPRFRYV